MQSNRQPLLRIRELKKHYAVRRGRRKQGQPVRVLDGVSFDIWPGETYGLVGESGCGKSTLGRSLLRLVEITAGEIHFDGELISALPESALKPFRRRVQAIFQDPYSSLNPGMTVAQLIAEPMRIHGYARGERQVRTLELLNRVGLKAEHLHRFPHEFSGGQRQRICIARALSVNPQFVVCDEPLSALDVSVQAQVVNLLQDLQQERGLTYLFIAHDLSMVRHISDRIGVMYQGRLVEEAPAEQLYLHPTHPYTRMLLASIPIPDPRAVTPDEPIVAESGGSAAAGCPFYARCLQASEQCRAAAPPLRDIAAGHRVACWHGVPEPEGQAIGNGDLK
ncbi:ABC transporter ATP-binding protein [Dickeya fangzhongdai]|uniref:Peptide ABC transporter substrate-binding protein n=1 Tax=Dickeya fangzhongdai TaxID=1778540 RepID=A0A2K8QKY5_9GAMM|nr:oligopeptide/dipeptide ABC transporter ATP-binding protein [Dickeya fangzhongdai]ATZ94169.1 peptide ABC transporter substrate-binding protein [Dickeya fangzhongdai]QOH47604.1 ABC transporter ATP-binding protein [Dickeya fangzhongdai]QOH51910.1 ABC transporter ATP-binding protein [Dickeya fangzhongdai]WOY00892.1 ATP-binding cassette domain-containing protein [Dickeya fangzhongdai]WOY03956.1 ATP-binding cassette domain-containing protein [Dickeya fangzhongdai]